MNRFMKLMPCSGRIAFLLVTTDRLAAQTLDQQAADYLMRNDRLNAVIIVLLIIFAALIILLIRQEIKIRQLQKKINDNHE